MTDLYMRSVEPFVAPVIPTNERYDVLSYSVDDGETDDDNGIEYFPLFETQENIFKELPDFVWENRRAQEFLLQLAIQFEKKKSPFFSYPPLRAIKEDDFFVLEWVFQDKRFTFYFSDAEDDKYSVLFFNADEKTFVNSVKKITQERYKEIAEEITSFIS